MKTTTKRYDIFKDENLFSLVIFPQRDKWKLNLLFAWCVCWSICGVIFIANYINFSNQYKYFIGEYNRCQVELKTQVQLKTNTQLTILKDIEKNKQQRLILIVVICFWAFYEYKVGKAYLFRKFGHEKLWIKKNGQLYFKREINKKGKTINFDIAYVKKIQFLEYNKNDFFQNVSRSFWTLNGESIAFDYHAKTFRFGIQLQEKEAKEICEHLKSVLKKMTRN